MTPWVRNLLIANFGVHLLVMTNQQLYYVLGLRLYLVPIQPWTPLTYMFVHAPGLWHIGFNMLALYFFGPRLEAQLGSKHFIWLYLVSGLGGALGAVFTPTTLIVGASGATFGVFLGYAWFWPRDKVLFWGVLPIETRWLVALATVYAVFGGVLDIGDVAHFAHLGGYAGAFVYLKLMTRYSAAARFRKRVEKATYGTTGDGMAEPNWDAIRRDGLHQMNLEEIDRLREKVKTYGIRSLTADERAFLHRMATR